MKTPFHFLRLGFGVQLVGGLLAGLLIPNGAQAAYGIFETYAVLNKNGTGNGFYDAGAATGNPDFQGANFGTLNPALNSLILNGGEVKTFKNGGGDVTGTAIFYRIYSGSPGGTFTQSGIPFNADLGGGNQKWQATGANINLLSGLNNGDYTLEIYFAAFGNDDTKFDNRGGLNYQATFSVVPEPTNLALGILGGVAAVGGLVRWRKNAKAEMLTLEKLTY